MSGYAADKLSFWGLLEIVNKKRHVASKHNVRFEKSRFDNILSGIISVNSFHKLGITAQTLGSDLQILATSDDYVIEAFHNQHPIVGIMWHPERNKVFADMDKLLVLELIDQTKRDLKLTKAIILAAGVGSRLRPYTDDCPKGMVEVNGKPILEHQFETLKQAGVNEIIVVCGYLKDKSLLNVFV